MNKTIDTDQIKAILADIVNNNDDKATLTGLNLMIKLVQNIV